MALFAALALCLPLSGAIPPAAQSDPRYALGYLVVTHYPGVKADGTGDSTAGIQAAIVDAYNNGLATFFPPGVYRISDTLKCYEWNFWDPSRNRAKNPDTRNHVLVGSTLGAARPLIKLAAGAPLFGDSANPRPLISYRIFSATNASGVSAVEPTEPILGTPPNFMDQPNILFASELRGIDFDCGGNAGAVGVVMRGAQDSSIEDVKVWANGASSGIRGRNSGAFNIEVEGGQYGLDLIDGGLAGPVVAGARLIGQTGSAIRQADFCPLMLVGFQIAMDKGPAVSVQTISYGTAPGTMALVDGSIEFASGGRAIDNASAAKTIYLRNIFVKGESELIKSGSQAAVVGSGEWARIAEYAYTDQTTPAGKPPYADGDKKFRTFSMVEGVVSRTPEPVRLIESDASAPPGSLVSRHLWRALPSYEGQADGTVIATSAPYNAKPDDLLDDRAAIQAAIDAASAAGHGRVFLPKGQYQIGGPLVLRANTKLFGVGRDITEIAWHSSWQPTSGIVYMLETENDASADTTLAFLTITMRTQGGGTNAYGAFNYDRFGAIHWRAGRRSIIAAIKIAKEYAGTTMTKTNPRNVVLFTDSAGGKHYSLLQHSPLALGANPDFRVVKIDGTTAPLAFYGLNVECTKNGLTPCDANIELIGAQNVRIYGTKREGDGPTAIVRDSRNVGYFGHGRQVSNTPSGSGGMLQVLGSSENITIAPVIPDSTGSVPNGEPLVREHLSGGSVNEIIYPDCLSIYKRGELDDSMFGPSPDASVTTGKAYM